MLAEYFFMRSKFKELFFSGVSISLKSVTLLFISLNKLMLAIKSRSRNLNCHVLPLGISKSVVKQSNFFSLQY